MSFAESTADLSVFRGASRRDWEKLVRWIDDSGIAFYFLAKLRESKSEEAVPEWALSVLERNYAANRKRTDFMWQRFGFLNRQFEDAGVKYAVLKGFSHVPQFSPKSDLRHQGDLDYLVDEQSLSSAQRVLEEAGYFLKPLISDQEFVYVPQETANLTPDDGRCYEPQFHAVELHLDVWDSDLNRLPIMSSQFSVERTVVHSLKGLAFPALSDEDAYVLQMLHTCKHLFTYWVRMSCLLEIAYFLRHRALDAALWGRVEERVGDNHVLRELTVMVTELVSGLFAAPIPALICEWGKDIRPSVRVWIDNYARQCAFWDVPVYRFRMFPDSKLILLLHRQYQELCDEKHAVRDQLIAPSRLSRIKTAVRKEPKLLLDRSWWKRQRIAGRTWFHLMAGVRYICELPRWQRLNRARVRLASRTTQAASTFQARNTGTAG
jgi:hypothetical protein